MKYYKDILIETERRYHLNDEAFDKLSDYAKEQFLKEWKEFVLENCEDFQMFDEFVSMPIDIAADGDTKWLQSIAEEYNLDFEKAMEEDCYWIGDAFESEDDFQRYIDDQKEPFLNSFLEGDYSNIPLAFQSSDFYNIYLFVEPVREEHKHGAYSLFDANSYSYKSADDELYESEEEEALYSVAEDLVYVNYYDFVELGLEILAKYPNADMVKVAEWMEQQSEKCRYLDYKLEGNCLVASADDIVERMKLVA